LVQMLATAGKSQKEHASGWSGSFQS